MSSRKTRCCCLCRTRFNDDYIVNTWRCIKKRQKVERDTSRKHRSMPGCRFIYLQEKWKFESFVALLLFDDALSNYARNIYLALSVSNLLETVLYCSALHAKRCVHVCVRVRACVHGTIFASCGLESIYLPTSFPVVCKDFVLDFFSFVSLFFFHVGT